MVTVSVTETTEVETTGTYNENFTITRVNAPESILLTELSKYLPWLLCKPLGLC